MEAKRRPASDEQFVRGAGRHRFGLKKGAPQIREEWTRSADGALLRYSVAYIDHAMYSGDNGRVLGYDNAHGVHERHFMGVVEEVQFVSYAQHYAAFLDEVPALRAKQHGEKR